MDSSAVWGGVEWGGGRDVDVVAGMGWEWDRDRAGRGRGMWRWGGRGGDGDGDGDGMGCVCGGRGRGRGRAGMGKSGWGRMGARVILQSVLACPQCMQCRGGEGRRESDRLIYPSPTKIHPLVAHLAPDLFNASRRRAP